MRWSDSGSCDGDGDDDDADDDDDDDDDDDGVGRRMVPLSLRASVARRLFASSTETGAGSAAGRAPIVEGSEAGGRGAGSEA